MWLSFWLGHLQSGLIPLPLLLYSAHTTLKSPKSGISLPPMSSTSYHSVGEKRKTEQNLSCVTVLVSSPPHTQRTAGHTAGYPVFAALHQLPEMSFLQLSSRDRLPRAPSRQQGVDYRQLRR